MTTYRFVTKPEHEPERVESAENDFWWSCSRNTKAGDDALVYVAGVGIQYEWEVVCDAEPNQKWKYICDVEHLRTLVPAIPISEICDVVTRDEWAPPYLNFRGYKSIVIPDAVAERVRALRPRAAGVLG